VSYSAASITRRFRGHAHPGLVRHRSPQHQAANHYAVASGFHLPRTQIMHW